MPFLTIASYLSAFYLWKLLLSLLYNFRLLTFDSSLMLELEQYELLTDFLSSTHEITPYQRHGMSHPLAFFPPQAFQVEDIDSILGHLSDEPIERDDMAVYNYGFLHSLQNSGRNLFNGVTFSYKRLREKPLRIDAALGHYFDMIATCAAMEGETYDVMSQGDIRFPLRSQYMLKHRGKEAVLSGKGRSAAIGGVMLVVFKHEGQYKAIVSQRTAAHATDPDKLHLLPAFIFQPMGDKPAEEWSFKHHLYREYLEELFGMEEGHAEMASHPALADLQAMEADGRAYMRLTGITISLFTLRPEISAMLLIKDESWWEDAQSGKRGYQFNMPESRGNPLLVPIESDESALAALPENYFLKIVPVAITALWQGIDAARELILNP
jgi:hypothetical protein